MQLALQFTTMNLLLFHSLWKGNHILLVYINFVQPYMSIIV